MLSLKNLTFTGLSSLILIFSPVSAKAQFEQLDLAGGIGKGIEAQMMQQLLQRQREVMSRGLRFDSANKVLSDGQTKISFTVTNRYRDTAHYSIKIYSDSQPRLIFPDEDKAEKDNKTAPAERPKRSMIADDEDVAQTTVPSYKDLTPYLTVGDLTGKLAPGQSKTFTVSVNALDGLPAGSYAAWVTSTVELYPGMTAKAKEGDKKSSAKGNKSPIDSQVKTNDADNSDLKMLLAGVKVNTFTRVVLNKK